MYLYRVNNCISCRQLFTFYRVDLLYFHLVNCLGLKSELVFFALFSALVLFYFTMRLGFCFYILYTLSLGE